MKKVISFVLVLALVLGSFSMAFADVTTLTDVKGNDNAEAINVVNGLGIVTGYEDGTFQPEKAVTRAEFAAMITRALNIPDSALAGYTTTSFKDTTGYGWAVKYLAFCADKGIMLGDGNGNVMPGRTINTNEAMTMVLRALGLTDNSAYLVGSWPANYVTVAKAEGLYTDVAAAALVDRANAAQIIYNALTLEMYAVDADGATDRITGSELIDELGGTEEPAVIIGGTVFEGLESLITTKDMNGAFATYYTNEDGEVIAIADVKTTFLEGEFNADGNFEVGDVTYKITGSTTTTGIATFVNNVVTNEAATVTTTDGLNCTLAVTLSGKTITQVYSQMTWVIEEYVTWDSAELDEEINQDNGNYYYDTYQFATEENDDDEWILSDYVLVGADDVTKIADDSIVTVYLNPSDSKIVKLEVSTDTVEGKVTKIDKYGDYVINGTAYTVSGSAVSDIDVAQEGTGSLAYDGTLVVWDATVDTTGNYAIVIATADAEDDGFESNNGKVRLFTKEGEDITVYLSDSYATELGTSVTSITKEAVYTYALNKDGELNALNEVAGTTDAATSFTSKLVLAGSARVDENAVVFVKNGVADYEIGKVANIKTGDTAFTGWYDTEDTKVQCLVVDKAAMGTDDKVYAVISVTEAAIDADDYDVIEVTGLADGKDYVAKTEDNSAKFQNIDGIVELTVDADGIITNVTGVATSESDDIIVDYDGSLVKTSTGGVWILLADDVIVYEYDGTDDVYTVTSIKAAKKAGSTVKFYNVAESDDYVADIIVYTK